MAEVKLQLFWRKNDQYSDSNVIEYTFELKWSGHVLFINMCIISPKNKFNLIPIHFVHLDLGALSGKCGLEKQFRENSVHINWILIRWFHGKLQKCFAARRG